MQVELDHAANVILLNDVNYSAFRHGGRYRYFGGYYKQTPVRLVPPHEDSWHVVVHLGGYACRVNASMVLT
ncbi:MAG: DUF1883 domain-containing protein [Pirellulales bacterium]